MSIVQDILQSVLQRVPALKSLLLDNLCAILVAAFLLGMLTYGYRKGLMTRILSLCSVILSLILEIRIFPYLMDFLTERAGIRELFRAFGKSFFFDQAGRQYSPLYELMGLDTLAENAGERIGELAVQVLCFLMLFILIRLAIRAALMFVKGLRRISVIRWVDSWLGAVLGLAEGLIYVWIAMFVLAGLPNFVFTRAILDQIMHNRFLFMLYNENLITQFVGGILHR